MLDPRPAGAHGADDVIRRALAWTAFNPGRTLRSVDLLVDYPLDVAVKRGPMTIHPVSKLVGFHQDGAAPILVKTKKTKDRGLSTKKIGTANTIGLVAHPKGIGAQSRTSIAFFDAFANKLASVSTKASFSTDGYAVNGIWGYEGGRGKPLKVVFVGADLEPREFSPLPKDKSGMGLYALPKGKGAVLMCGTWEEREVFVFRHDGSVQECGSGRYGWGGYIALHKDSGVEYVDAVGNPVDGSKIAAKSVLTAEGAQPFSAGDEVSGEPALLLTGVRLDDGNREVSKKLFSLPEPGPILAWDLIGSRVGWVTPTGIKVAASSSLEWLDAGQKQ